MADPAHDEFSRALLSVADLLEGLGSPYVVFGSVAVGIWGRIRATLDVDFMVRTDGEGLRRVEVAAEAAGLLVLQKIRAQRDYDFGDAISVIEEQKGQLDEDYLDLWARRLGVHEELDYVWRHGAGG
jgi:hypothetical protein